MIHGMVPNLRYSGRTGACTGVDAGCTRGAAVSPSPPTTRSSIILRRGANRVSRAPLPSSDCEIMASNEGSRRWMHFHSALQLAIQRAAHKWTCVLFTLLTRLSRLHWLRFEDFIECFSLWAEESPDGASSVFNTISNFQESQITVCILFFCSHFGLLTQTQYRQTSIIY